MDSKNMPMKMRLDDMLLMIFQLCIQANIWSDNGLVPSGNKPLTDPLLPTTKTYVVTMPQWINPYRMSMLSSD